MDSDSFLLSKDREGQRDRNIVINSRERERDLQEPLMPAHNFSQLSQQSEDVPSLPPLSIHDKGKSKQKYEDSLDE
jgi:hypothetical protein